MRTASRIAWLFLVGVSCVWGGGCTPAAPSNLSPTADQDAGRLENAERYSRELARKNQEAEKKAMSRLPRR